MRKIFVTEQRITQTKRHTYWRKQSLFFISLSQLFNNFPFINLLFTFSIHFIIKCNSWIVFFCVIQVALCIPTQKWFLYILWYYDLSIVQFYISYPFSLFLLYWIYKLELEETMNYKLQKQLIGGVWLFPCWKKYIFRLRLKIGNNNNNRI